MCTIIQGRENSRDDPAPGPHRSFEERFAEQFGAFPEESDIHFNNEELDWNSPQGAEVW